MSRPVAVNNTQCPNKLQMSELWSFMHHLMVNDGQQILYHMLIEEMKY